MHDIWNPWHGCIKCSEGCENVFFNVSTENQKRADERIPILLDLPFKHKGIMCAPFVGPVSIRKYLEYGQIEQQSLQSEQAFLSGLSYIGKPMEFKLYDEWGYETDM